MIKKALEINMHEARKAGAENLEAVMKIVDNLKGSKNQHNQPLLCSYTQAHYSGLVFSDGGYGATESAGKAILPLATLKAADGMNLFSGSDPVKIIGILRDGLDIVEMKGD